MKYLLLTALLFCVCPGVRGEELPEVLAKFGTVEFRKEHFRQFRLPVDREERRRTLKNLVDTQVCLIIVRKLLELSRIPADEKTARRYVALRRAQFGGKLPEVFAKDLESRVKHPDFQLKSALYFTFLAAEPSSVEPSPVEVGRHYDLNRESFRKPVKSEIALFRVGKNDEAGRERTRLILGRLRQGEDFQALARQFDPQGVRGAIPAGNAPLFERAVRELKPGEARPVPAGSEIFMLKLVSRSEGELIPLAEAAPAIRELLSGRMQKDALEQYIREVQSKTPVQYFF